MRKYEFNQQARLVVVAMAICVVGVFGCKATQKHPDSNARLVAVPQESNKEPSSVAQPLAPSKSAGATVRSNLADGLNYCKDAIVVTLKTTGSIVGGSIFWAVDSMFGSDDDEGGESPRRRADRELNQWTDDRDKWIRAER